MFHITSTATEHLVPLKIAGCPENGLAALDFRVLHGLPTAATNQAQVELHLVSETLARKFAHLLNSRAEIVLSFVKDPQRPDEFHDQTVIEPALLKKLLELNEGGRVARAELLLQVLEKGKALYQKAHVAEQRIKASFWAHTMRLSTLIQYQDTPSARMLPASAWPYNEERGLDSSEVESLILAVQREIEEDKERAEDKAWGHLLEKLTPVEQNMRARGMLKPEQVEDRLALELLASFGAPATWGGASSSTGASLASHPVKERCEEQEFLVLCAFEQQFGVTGRVTGGDGPYLFSVQLDFEVAGRRVPVTFYPEQARGQRTAYQEHRHGSFLDPSLFDPQPTNSTKPAKAHEQP